MTPDGPKSLKNDQFASKVLNTKKVSYFVNGDFDSLFGKSVELTLLTAKLHLFMEAHEPPAVEQFKKPGKGLQGMPKTPMNIPKMTDVEQMTIFDDLLATERGVLPTSTALGRVAGLRVPPTPRHLGGEPPQRLVRKATELPKEQQATVEQVSVLTTSVTGTAPISAKGEVVDPSAIEEQVEIAYAALMDAKEAKEDAVAKQAELRERAKAVADELACATQAINQATEVHEEAKVKYMSVKVLQ